MLAVQNAQRPPRLDIQVQTELCQVPQDPQLLVVVTTVALATTWSASELPEHRTIDRVVYIHADERQCNRP